MRQHVLRNVCIILLAACTSVGAQETNITSAELALPERLGVYVVSNNLDRSRNFYETVFGASPKIHTDVFIGFDVAGGLFAVVSKNAFAPNSVIGGNVVPYIRVSDAGAAYQRLNTVTPAAMANSKLIHEGSLSLFKFTDPDGNVIEYFSLSTPIEGL